MDDERHVGRLIDWKDDRGFGFIAPHEGGGDVFVHINDFTNRRFRPKPSLVVSYRLTADDRGRPRAQEVTFVGVEGSDSWQPKRRWGWLVGPIVVSLAIGLLAATGNLPASVPLVYLVLSLVEFVLFAWDKAAARAGRWRQPEARLLTIALLGGWPGGVLAQVLFDHKTTKADFRIMFHAATIVNVAILGVAVAAAFGAF